MSDIHIADFFKDTAATLCYLYASFPNPATLFVDEISGPDETDQFGMHGKRHMACLSAIAWLADEGYLRYDTLLRQEAFDQAVLTGPCFTVLSLPQPDETESASELPATVQAERATHVFSIRHALKRRSSREIRQAVMAVMREMSLPGAGISVRPGSTAHPHSPS